MVEALAQAERGRLIILGKMDEVISTYLFLTGRRSIPFRSELPCPTFLYASHSEFRTQIAQGLPGFRGDLLVVPILNGSSWKASRNIILESCVIQVIQLRLWPI